VYRESRHSDIYFFLFIQRQRVLSILRNIWNIEFEVCSIFQSLNYFFVLRMRKSKDIYEYSINAESNYYVALKTLIVYITTSQNKSSNRNISQSVISCLFCECCFYLIFYFSKLWRIFLELMQKNGFWYYLKIFMRK